MLLLPFLIDKLNQRTFFAIRKLEEQQAHMRMLSNLAAELGTSVRDVRHIKSIDRNRDYFVFDMLLPASWDHADMARLLIRTLQRYGYEGIKYHNRDSDTFATSQITCLHPASGNVLALTPLFTTKRVN